MNQETMAIMLSTMFLLGGTAMGLELQDPQAPQEYREIDGEELVLRPYDAVTRDAWIDPGAVWLDIQEDGVADLTQWVAGLVLELTENPILSPDFTAAIETPEGPIPFEPEPFGAYHGHLLGEERLKSPLTVSNTYFHVRLDHPDAGRLSIETVQPPVANEDGQLLHIVELATAATPEPGLPNFDVGANTAKPVHPVESRAHSDESNEDTTSDPLVGSINEYTAVPIEEYDLGVVVGWDRPATQHSFDIWNSADYQYYQLNTGNVCTRMSTNTNAVESWYDDQINHNWFIDSCRAFGSSSGNPSPNSNDCYDIRDAFRNYYRTNYPVSSTNDRDFLNGFVHREMVGSTIGCAYLPGLHDKNNRGYQVSQMIRFGASDEQDLIAHEIGHIFNGRHQYSKEWRSGSCMWLCTKHTIMHGAPIGNTHEFTEGIDWEANAFRIRQCNNPASNCNSMPTP